MPKKPSFDTAEAHRYFSAQCFNQAWELIDKTDRTTEEDRQMLLRTQASLWHWTQREDCTDQNLSVGHWQTARVYALLGQADNAREHGRLSLEYSAKEPPFYQAYAYEALARAEMVAGDKAAMAEYLDKARELTETLTDPDEKKFLEADLATIK
jgi:hypothetical protein